MSTESNSNAQAPPLWMEFTILRLGPGIIAAFERTLRKQIPGMAVQRMATWQKEILFRASSYSPRDFVILGMAIQIFNDEYDHEDSNRQLEKAPTGSQNDC